MNTNEKNNYVRQKCIEANPEILEVKFGCEVIVRNGEVRVSTKYIVIEANPVIFGTVETKMLYCVAGVFRLDMSVEEIIGRPIRLADVLKTFDGLTIFGALPIGPQVENILHLYGQVAGYWKLTNDDLRFQSEEAISFIYDILK